VLALRFEMHPFGGWLAAIPLAALFIAATVFAYRRTTRSLSPRQLRLLWALRGVAVLAVLFVFLRPSWVSLETRLERPVVVVLRDDSPSMGIADAPPSADAQPGTSRLDAVTACLRANRANLQALAERYDLAAFDFSDRIESLSELPSDEAGDPARRAVAQRVIEQLTPDHATNGRSTKIGDALQRVVDTFASRRVAAVLLLSDLAGNASDVPPAEAAQKLGHRSTPVYPVVFGATQPTAAVRDSIARTIQAPATVFVGNRVNVSGDYRFHGLKGRTIAVSLLADGTEVGQQTVTVPENRCDQRVTIAYRPEQPGSRRLELRAAAVEGEAVVENNSILTSIDVLPGGLKVLLVQGSPLTEGRFVFAALREAGQFDCDSVVLGDADAAKAIPVTAAAWAVYRTVILIDVPRAALSDAQVSSLCDAVATREVGLLMTGGERSFGPGGWAGTPLAEMLPVQIAASDRFIEKTAAFQPTATGLQSSLMQLDLALGVDEAWKTLPALDWANQVGRAKGSAEVLAVGAGGEPLLALGRYGGRVAALMVGTTWRWQLGGHEDPPGAYFKRFWRQLVLHLTGQASRNLWVTTGDKRYSLADLASGRRKVQVTVGVTDSQNRPVTDARCDLVLSGPGDRGSAVSLAPSGETFAATLRPTEVGEYELRLAVHRAGAKLGEATTRFVVYEPYIEWEQPLADPAAANEVARPSGGRLLSGGELGDVLKNLAARDLGEMVTVPRTIGLWDNRYVLAVFAAALAAEWLLRKRWGLV
jgi:uncharacterized membrane protein